MALPEYIEIQVSKKVTEIVEGYELTDLIVPGSKPVYIEILKKEYIQAVGYLKGLRSCDVEDRHVIKVLSIKRAIKALTV